MSGVLAARPGFLRAWLKDPAADWSLILGAVLLALIAGGLAIWDPALLPILVVMDVWLLGYHHVIATFTKLAGTPEDRRRNRFLIFGLPWIVLAGTIAAAAGAGIWLVATVYFFWQWFHYTRQSWGIAQAYRRRAGGMAWDPPWLAELTLWSVAIWGLLGRCAQQPELFLGFAIWMPPVPASLVAGAGALTVALLLVWLFQRAAAFARGELALGHTAYLLSHFLVFAGGYLLIPDIDAGWLSVNVWHNAQYIAFVWIHNRARFGAGVRRDAWVLSTLSQPGRLRAALYFCCGALVTLVVYRLIELGANAAAAPLKMAALSLTIVAVMTFNFHHYVVDALIWKQRRAAS
jgi:hypothetical protein